MISLPSAWALSRTETRLFHILVRHRFAGRQRIVRELYPSGTSRDPRIVKVLVFLLRKKLQPHGIAIHTKYGYGYSLDDDVRRRFTPEESTS